MNGALIVENLHSSVNGKEILKGVNLRVEPGEFHVIMGPNGSGKSTLALTIAGHPRYKVTAGRITFKGMDVTNLPPHERAKAGIFLAFQQPYEVEGVRIIEFLQQILKELRGMDGAEAYDRIVKMARELWFREEDLYRFINVGFSGGERKRLELLQALLIRPDLLILDEPDSGVDVDSMSIISRKIEQLNRDGASIVLITHYGKILEHLDPESLNVHVMKEGRIVLTRGGDFIGEIEKRGFQDIFKECCGGD